MLSVIIIIINFILLLVNAVIAWYYLYFYCYHYQLCWGTRLLLCDIGDTILIISGALILRNTSIFLYHIIKIFHKLGGSFSNISGIFTVSKEIFDFIKCELVYGACRNFENIVFHCHLK